MPQKRKSKKFSRVLPSFIGLLAAVAVSFYVYRTCRDILVQTPEWKTKRQADFPGMDGADALPKKVKARVVEKANQEFCSCGCGYILAACLKYDLSCPIRPANLKRVNELIAEARGATSTQ
jgi:hypothetical protein